MTQRKTFSAAKFAIANPSKAMRRQHMHIAALKRHPPVPGLREAIHDEVCHECRPHSTLGVRGLDDAAGR
jgi:hypothetical protein